MLDKTSIKMLYTEYYSKPIMDTMNIDLAVGNIAWEITDLSDIDWRSESPPLYVGVLNGGMTFFSDITKFLPSGYCQYVGREGEEPKIPMHYSEEVKRIFIFDLICDTGSTLSNLVKKYQNCYPNALIHTVCLLVTDRPNKVLQPNYCHNMVQHEFKYKGYGLCDEEGIGANEHRIFCIEGSMK